MPAPSTGYPTKRWGSPASSVRYPANAGAAAPSVGYPAKYRGRPHFLSVTRQGAGAARTFCRLSGEVPGSLVLPIGYPATAGARLRCLPATR